MTALARTSELSDLNFSSIFPQGLEFQHLCLWGNYMVKQSFWIFNTPRAILQHLYLNYTSRSGILCKSMVLLVLPVHKTLTRYRGIRCWGLTYYCLLWLDWYIEDHIYLPEVSFLLGPEGTFLFTSNLFLSNETAHWSSHVDSKSNSLTKAVTCCHIILYWKMNALVWSTSFYWATRVHDGRYGWEKHIPNH